MRPRRRPQPQMTPCVAPRELPSIAAMDSTFCPHARGCVVQLLRELFARATRLPSNFMPFLFVLPAWSPHHAVLA